MMMIAAENNLGDNIELQLEVMKKKDAIINNSSIGNH